MIILSLDISTKTGWSVADIKDGQYFLMCAGTLQKREIPHDEYPKNYLDWAIDCASDIEELINSHKPDILVIEETSKGSKNNFSQKILEFIHCFMAMYITKHKFPTHYYRTEEWRRICDCTMTKEEKKHNAKRSRKKTKLKKNNENTSIIKDKDGKRLGKITKKHVNIRRANELFNLELKLKDEDRADAILLGYAYYLSNYQK